MRTFFDLLIMFMMLMVLAACSAANPTSDTTLIPTLFPQLSSELEDLERPSTVTARPSSTPLPSATADQTQTAIYQTIASTQSAEQTLLARFPRICRDNYALGSFSPNSLWMEEFCYSEDDGSPILTLSNKDTKALWKLLYRDYVDFMPDGGMSVVHWSDDGQYAYFNSYLATSGGYCFMGGNVLNHGTGLFRVDLDSGSTSTILPRRENFVGYSFSFSLLADVSFMNLLHQELRFLISRLDN